MSDTVKLIITHFRNLVLKILKNGSHRFARGINPLDSLVRKLLKIIFCNVIFIIDGFLIDNLMNHELSKVDIEFKHFIGIMGRSQSLVLGNFLFLEFLEFGLHGVDLLIQYFIFGFTRF